MTMIYAVDSSGNYLGQFSGGTVTERLTDGTISTRETVPELPDGAIEIDAPPDDPRQTWDGTAWSAAPPPPPRYVDKLKIVDRLIAGSLIEAALAAMTADPILKIRWDAAPQINVSDPAVLAFLAGIGADPVVILAP